MSNYVPDDSSFTIYNQRFGIKPEYYDYTTFYAVITICTVVAVILIAVNLICCCCGEHKDYCADPDTGNRFASFLFVRSPRQKPMEALLV